MRPIRYERAADTRAALTHAGEARAVYFAGGTTLLDLMKLDVMALGTLIDISPLQAEHGRIETDAHELTLGEPATWSPRRQTANLVSDQAAAAERISLRWASHNCLLGSVRGLTCNCLSIIGFIAALPARGGQRQKVHS